MKFKVGDRVRYNRETILEALIRSEGLYYYATKSFEVIQINGEEVRSEEGHWFHENELELVPEEELENF